jgi:CMP/dCMP kinase
VSTPNIIAIDGPAASGKTTLALTLAHDLDYLYFDTGVMYRAVTLAAMDQSIDLTDESNVTDIAKSIEIDVIPSTESDGRPCTVKVDGEDVTWKLRGHEVDKNVSIPSAYAGVRKAMTDQQRKIGNRGRVVMVGRDIGTVVLPNADLKIYLDASAEARAQRRWQEFSKNGSTDSYQQILDSMKNRDKLDSQRQVAPLRPAEDAYVIDSTSLDADEVVQRVKQIIESY